MNSTDKGRCGACFKMRLECLGGDMPLSPLTGGAVPQSPFEVHARSGGQVWIHQRQADLFGSPAHGLGVEDLKRLGLLSGFFSGILSGLLAFFLLPMTLFLCESFETQCCATQADCNGE